ncbi:nitrous oxide reductase accessory protein NosL [Brevibacillus ginsengisoli]|uniref:nitrous oxide reductase accessory protein NosL n=1 Tax=Brevibacillus ginsengisoli TaxID=363854 RepID=UPI003CFB7AD0
MYSGKALNWSKMMVAGLVSISLIGGSGLLVEAAGSAKSPSTPVSQPAAKPLPTNNQAVQQLSPTEPAVKEECGLCKMEVYGKGHEMGQFIAQVVTADGKNLFFDDLGCMMNYKHTQTKPVKAIWVRDYYTKEWFLASKATLVSSEIKTPMHYGYAVFKDKASAAKFIKENKAQHAALSSWKDLDTKAQERYKAKMNGKMKMPMNNMPTNMQQPQAPTPKH